MNTELEAKRIATGGEGGAASRRKPWPRRLLALAIAAGVSLVLGEVLFRCVYGVPLRERLPLMEVRAHPRRGFEMIPHTEHYTYLERVRVNDLGLRGPDLGPKPPNEVRVVVLGDSLVFGQGVAEEDTIPARMERAFAETAVPEAPACRVVNAGVRSYATEQELALFDELLPTVEPGVAVLCWFANDVEDQRIQSTYERLSRTGPIVFDLGEPANERAELSWKLQQILRRSALVMRLHDLWSEAHYPVLAPADLDRAYAKLAGELAAWKRACEDRGVDALVAIVPLAKYLERAEPHPSTSRVRDLAREQGLPVVDLAPALQELVKARGSLPVLPYDGHYTGEANDVMARTIVREIRERFPARFAPH